MRLQDRVCVVNGAASVIGAAVADRLRREGGTVVGVDLEPHTVGDRSLTTDLRVGDEVRAMYASVVAEFGRLDVVDDNVGLMDRGDLSLLDTDLETWRAVQDANVTTTFLCCKHGVPHLLATQPSGGSIVNSASFLAELGAPTAQMGYAAGTIAFLVSDDAGFITAAAIPLDGGISRAFTVPEGSVDEG